MASRVAEGCCGRGRAMRSATGMAGIAPMLTSLARTRPIVVVEQPQRSASAASDRCGSQVRARAAALVAGRALNMVQGMIRPRYRYP